MADQASSDAGARVSCASGVDVANVHQDAMHAHDEEVSVDEQREARLEKHRVVREGLVRLGLGLGLELGLGLGLGLGSGLGLALRP